MNLRFALPVVFGVVMSATLLAEGSQEPQDFLKKVPFGPGGPGGRERKLVSQFDKDGDGRLNNEERKAAREFVQKQPGGPGKGFKGKGMPTEFLAKQLIEALDRDKDGKLSADELKAGITKFFTQSATHDLLAESQLADGLSRFFPAPMGFGPGFPPKDKGEFGPPGGPPKDKKGFGKDGFGKKGFGEFGPPGMPIAHAIFERADADKDAKLTLKELNAAAEKQFKDGDRNRDAVLDEAELGAIIGAIMPMPEFGPGGKRDPAKPGPKVAPDQVKTHSKESLYDPGVLRTLFLTFENKDWESELEDFYKSDVEVPATLIVDGKTYPNVGVHFRGMSSYMMVPAGYKRSLNLALDFVDSKQRLNGYKTLNLLNSNGDPSLLSTVLYSHIARKFIPAPKANLVKVVINGESWGVYTNVQQFNKEFIEENFKTTRGARWKVPGSPGGDSGLAYLGENIDDYRRRYQIKSSDDEKVWKALIKVCRTLEKTPLDKLEEALKPILDIDGALKFLALDVVLSNSDGYWTRASDYSIYLDPKGKFHVIPHDMNEAFQAGMGKGPPKGGFAPPGGGKEMGRGGSGPDPLVGLDDTRKPLRSRLLAVPNLRKRYLEYVRAVAEELDWVKLGPVVAQYRTLIEKEVELDTRKLSSLEAFRTAVYDAGSVGPRPGLRAFADSRRSQILGHPEVKKAGAE